MALFFTATLLISLGGMMVLLLLKRFEMATGRVVLRHARPRVGAFFHSFLTWFERDLPGSISSKMRGTTASLKRVLHYWIARGILAAEHALERGLGLLRHTTTTPSSAGAGEASAFLREVAEHKRKLLKRTPAQTSAPLKDSQE